MMRGAWTKTAQTTDAQGKFKHLFRHGFEERARERHEGKERTTWRMLQGKEGKVGLCESMGSEVGWRSGLVATAPSLLLAWRWSGISGNP